MKAEFCSSAQLCSALCTFAVSLYTPYNPQLPCKNSSDAIYVCIKGNTLAADDGTPLCAAFLVASTFFQMLVHLVRILFAVYRFEINKFFI